MPDLDNGHYYPTKFKGDERQRIKTRATIPSRFQLVGSVIEFDRIPVARLLPIGAGLRMELGDALEDGITVDVREELTDLVTEIRTTGGRLVDCIRRIQKCVVE